MVGEYGPCYHADLILILNFTSKTSLTFLLKSRDNLHVAGRKAIQLVIIQRSISVEIKENVLGYHQKQKIILRTPLV